MLHGKVKVKLRISGVTLPDQYDSIDQELWTDDVTRWPTFEFGDL